MTSGSSNTAAGDGALGNNPIGNDNTATGAKALAHNTTDSFNTSVGKSSMYLDPNIPTCSNNTATGYLSLASITTGNKNSAYGNNALLNNSNGSSNIALGDSAGINLTTGSNNIDIGNTGVAGESGKIRIGTKPTHMATFIAGVSGATVAGGVGVLINTNGQLGTVQSSARFKEAIKPMDKASDSILALEPVTFRYKEELDPEGIPQFGLVAEEVEKINLDLVARDEHGKAYTVRYEAVNAMLLNEFLKEHRKGLEQDATIAQLKSALADQRKDFASAVAEQKKEIETLRATLTEQAVQIQKVGARLEAAQAASRIVVNGQYAGPEVSDR